MSCPNIELEPILESVHQLVEDIGNEMFTEELIPDDLILNEE